MRYVAAVVGVLIWTSPAIAECNQGKLGILTLTDWSAMMKDGVIGPYPSVSITYKNDDPKEIRMIKATVWFDDALNERISGVALKKDIKIKAGETKVETFAMQGSPDFERLTKMEKRDATGYICAETAVYEDGTKQDFK